MIENVPIRAALDFMTRVTGRNSILLTTWAVTPGLQVGEAIATVTILERTKPTQTPPVDLPVQDILSSSCHLAVFSHARHSIPLLPFSLRPRDGRESPFLTNFTRLRPTTRLDKTPAILPPETANTEGQKLGATS